MAHHICKSLQNTFDMLVRMTKRDMAALVLSGGGARGAYQIGVLLGIARILKRAGILHADAPASPFQVYCGTSAGAINAAALACRTDEFEPALNMLAQLWRNLHVQDVYRADVLAMAGGGARWMSALGLGWMLRRSLRAKPRALLDNAPLAHLLAKTVDVARIGRMIDAGQLRALAVGASSYSAGVHATFYQASREIEPWHRSERMAVPVRIEIGHLMASASIPFVFPAQLLKRFGHDEWFGDGSMRQTAPLSPAIHLGADKMLVIGAGRAQEPVQIVNAPRYPSLASVAGHAMASIFLDTLAADVERLERVNRTVALIDPAHRSALGLRVVEPLVIAPSERLDDIAVRHAKALPRTVRALLRALGADDASGGGLTSYLLFEPAFTRELIALGEADAAARSDQIRAFFAV
jgi:NTE family protein